MLRRLLAVPACLLAGSLALAGCAQDGEDAGTDGQGLSVVAAFYPLQYVSERVGGDHVEVTNLTKPGAEPHDLELAPRDVGGLTDADVVVYLPGFQPSVDQAVEAEAPEAALDVTERARLDLRPASLDEAMSDHDHDHAGEAHTDEPTGAAAADDHEHGGNDPHFWLDPTRLADVADLVAERLADLDADNAQAYAANASALRAELVALDGQLQQGLATCASRELVTSHTAFGYLADRYGLHQVGLTGLAPESDPSAQDLADIARFVGANGVRTVYHETLVSPAVAEAVAEAAGVSTAVLDPLEGLTEASAGEDYREVMLANLATLRTGQPCS